MIGNLTVAKRLNLGFGFLMAVLAATVALGLVRMAGQNDMIGRIVSKDWQKTVLANEAMHLMNANARETFLLFHTSDRQTVRRRIEANKQAISDKLEALDKLVYRPEGKSLLVEIRERRKRYVDAFSRASELLESGKDGEASRLMAGEVVPALDRLLASVGNLVSLQDALLEEAGRESASSYQESRNTLLAALVLAILASTAMAFWIIRSVTGPLGGEPEDARRVVEAIAQGDLTQPLTVRPGDSHSLLAAMAAMQAALRKMVSDLQQNADGISSAAQQLATSSSQVATATSAQSEAASSMAAAVQEMTVSVGQVADRAGEAHGITATTGTLSAQGHAIIERTAEEMHAIAEIVGTAAEEIQAMGAKSELISGIVRVIKDVAEQTNLLALNAAIESARAGEQGRGFAVVADEVRKLAERTAGATMEISNMIGDVQASASSAVTSMRNTVARVEQGVGMARQARESMTGISSGAQSVVAAVSEISNALVEQNAASTEIAENVEKIAQMSEENGAATQDVAATAQHLETLATAARLAVARFAV